ncbi:hypothetical protein LH51_09410 [Nitrincola sp. A-D6]|uniref:methyltransferase domain-containing protein n=1 Tax=Nitrincola sp. A-D6 TaxID=1545442 RepID=UPI00051FAE19|nr:methyltransferase domain-containing protein [Nitrincola sp. A-D6]KGK42133.1 hypothetical protein LH51_09410 [Nitrincola sp. A-D6]
MATSLHQARIEAVITTLLNSGIQRVADLGCGQGELLTHLYRHQQFTRLLGIDIDSHAIGRARELLNLDLFNPDKRLHVCLGSFEDDDWAEQDLEAAVLLETIEHINPGRLTRVEQTLFNRLRFELVVITTPNQEYNPLHGMAWGERRHPGHHFEWTRTQFQAWCEGVAQRHGYQVSFEAIGPSDPLLGSSTQMACFSLSQ